MYSSFNARAVGLDLSARQTVELAASEGFGGVDLLVRDLLERGEDPREIRSRMDDLGLKGGAFPLPMDWKRGEETFLTDLQRLPRFAEAAEILGLKATATWVLPETPEQPASVEACTPYLASVARWHIDRLGQMARALEPFGIRLGIEVIGLETFRNGSGVPFVNRMGDLDQHLAPVWEEAGNLGILFDSYHLYAAGETAEDALAWGIERVVWVHVSDLHPQVPRDRTTITDHDRGLPGESGLVDCSGHLRLLKDAGYHGPVTAEPLASSRSLSGLQPEEIVRNLAQSLRSVWPTV